MVTVEAHSNSPFAPPVIRYGFETREEAIAFLREAVSLGYQSTQLVIDGETWEPDVEAGDPNTFYGEEREETFRALALDKEVVT